MTIETAIVSTDLDRLAERVERAANLIQELRARTAQLEAEKAELSRRIEDTTQKLQGNEPTTLVTELAALRKEQREWVAERRDVAGKIETLLHKLERIEA